MYKYIKYIKMENKNINYFRVQIAEFNSDEKDLKFTTVLDNTKNREKVFLEIIKHIDSHVINLLINDTDSNRIFRCFKINKFDFEKINETKNRIDANSLHTIKYLLQ